MRKKRVSKGLFSKGRPNWAKEVGLFILKIIAEVAKDKMARAVIIALVSSAGSLVFTSGDGEIQKEVSPVVKEVGQEVSVSVK